MNHPIPVSIHQCVISKTSATFNPCLVYEDWLYAGASLASIDGYCKWWIGDWVNHGFQSFKDRLIGKSDSADTDDDYAGMWKSQRFASLKISEILGYDSETVRICGWVSRRVPVVRRRTTLSWSHHCEVAALPPAEQEKWLAASESEKWSIADLRKELRAASSNRSAHESDGPVVRAAGNKLQEVCSFLDARPPEWWNEERKSIWRGRLKPLAELYAKL